jgi:hypothetical protein
MNLFDFDTNSNRYVPSKDQVPARLFLISSSFVHVNRLKVGHLDDKGITEKINTLNSFYDVIEYVFFMSCLTTIQRSGERFVDKY